MAEHTPGPWAVMEPVRVGGPLGDAADRGIVAGNVVIGEAWQHGPNRDGERVVLPAEANARLIAAAPQMLRALELAERSLAVRSSLRDGEQARVQVALETVRQVLAIARAEGAEVAP